MAANEYPGKSKGVNLDSNATGSDADHDLYQKVTNALHTNSLIDSDKITVRVKERRVYLEGTVDSKNQRNLAAACIADIFGIRTVANNITFPFDPGN
jgi:osmotically-inducible protein OsmY